MPVSSSVSRQQNFRKIIDSGPIWITRIGGIIVALVALGVLLFPVAQANAQRSAMTAVFAIGFLALFVGIIFWLPKVRGPSKISPANATLPWIIALVSCLVTFVIGRALAHSFGWDPAVLWDAAETLVRGEPATSYHYDYFSRYPNNIAMLVIDTAMVRVGDGLGIATANVIALFNAGVVFSISITTFFLTRNFADARSGFFAQSLVLVFIAASPWSSVPYTDLPGAALIVAGAVLAISRPTGKTAQIALFLLGAFVLAAAIVLKPSAWFALIAVAISMLFECRRTQPMLFGKDAQREACSSILRLREAVAVRSSFRKFLPIQLIRSTAFVVATVLGTMLISPLTVALSGLDHGTLNNDREFPATHWILVGLTETKSGDGIFSAYGGYSRDVASATGSAETAKERSELIKASIKSRLSELGADGLILFLTKKTVWTWGDGSFSAWNEGGAASEPLMRDGPVSSTVQSWNHPDGHYFQVKNELATGLWLALMSVAAGAMWLRPRSIPFLLTLAFLGVGGYTLLLETRARYLIVALPLIISLFAISLSVLQNIVSDRRNRRN